ncbi:hypothetical protein ACHWQZ_G015408 [Mnemiopsis leidyi]
MMGKNICIDQMDSYQKAGNIFSREEYRQLLMSYRFIMGLLAVFLNGFFIDVLHKFPLKDNSGYYMITRRLLKYLATADFLYGLCIMVQITVLLPAEQSYRTSHNCTDSLLDFLETDSSVWFQTNFSKACGVTRQGVVRAIIIFTLLITIIRFLFTVYPLRSIRLVVRLYSSWRCHALFLSVAAFAVLVKLRFNLNSVSACTGLLICENFTSFACGEITPKSTITSFMSFLVCSLILTLVGIIWTVANKKDKMMKSLLKIQPCYQSKNFKAVKTSLTISSVFLLCNSGPMVNQIVKIACGVGTPDPIPMQKAYKIADIVEQWFLPIMTVANCIIYTATNKKIKKFAVWYYRRQTRALLWWVEEKRGRGGARYRAFPEGVQVRVPRYPKPSILGRQQFYDNSF